MSRTVLIDKVYNELDELLLTFKFDAVRERLCDYAQTEHPLEVLFSVLIITSPYRENPKIKEARFEALRIINKIGDEAKIEETVKLETVKFLNRLR